MDRLLIALPLLVFGLTTLALTPSQSDKPVDPPLATWTMLAVNESVQQADAHLIQTRRNGTVLVDAGFRGTGIQAHLKKHGIVGLNAVLISHPHKDHYGGLWDLIETGIPLGFIQINIPPRDVCDSEKPWGCDWDDLQKLLTRMRAKGLEVRTAAAGEVPFDDGAVRFETLVAHDGISPPVGRTDVNDTSLIMRMRVGPHKVLFTGDLNGKLGEYLAVHQPDLHADILKVPHHGTEGVAPNTFFDRVSPFLALVPGPRALWRSDRSKRIRDYFANAHIPTLVSGIEGEVAVDFYPTEWRVRTERGR